MATWLQETLDSTNCSKAWSVHDRSCQAILINKVEDVKMYWAGLRSPLSWCDMAQVHIERLHMTSHSVSFYYFHMAKGRSTRASCNASCHAEETSVQLLYSTYVKMIFDPKSQCACSMASWQQPLHLKIKCALLIIMEQLAVSTKLEGLAQVSFRVSSQKGNV